MNYSIIIPSLYEVDKDYLKLCVESLRESGFVGQIIVVTNGASSSPVLSHIKGISTHLHTKQQGQCNAVNIGAQVAEGAYLMVSNSDMYYAPGWNEKLRFDDLVFSPNLVEPTNNNGSASPFLKLDAGFTLEEFDRVKVNKYIYRHTVQQFQVNAKRAREPGFNLPFFIKRDFWNFLGGYDVAFDPWSSNSDTDLQTRINLAGVTPMRLRDVLVYHFSNKTPTFSPENDAFRRHNFDYFYDKFGFSRDTVPGCDVWTNTNMIPEDKDRIKYAQPKYEA